MPDRQKGTLARRRALDAYIKLTRAAETVNARVREVITGFGLTEPQFAVLEALHHLGPLRASDLAGKLLRSGPSITSVIDNLEKAGLVERAQCSEDRRVCYVRLTADGEDRIRRIFPAVAGRITGLLSSLEPAEQEQLAALARKLGQNCC
jgi:MarR family 2-MHQ and catechol resistance regulon transcriptional repressor